MLNKNLGDRAIVIGGSIAGSLAARILSDYFEKVIIIDRDKFPDRPQARKGVAQSVQPHILLVRGYRILRELFPGIEQKLLAKGALEIDWAREFSMFSESGWFANSVEPSEIVSFTCSRPLLEWIVRDFILQIDNIEIIQETRVKNLIYNCDNNKITGVELDSKENKNLSAQLILDASGRGSNAPRWLENIGFNSPPETVINPLLGYATCKYREPENFQEDWKVLLVSQAAPNHKRLGYLARIENKEWIATLGGYNRDFPPLDRENFLKFARSLRHEKFYQLISQAKPISDIYAHRATENRLRHYEKINLPGGFIAIGDSVCALCPVYGQGMTVSALAAIVLRDWLEKVQKDFIFANNEFQKNLAKSNSSAWMLATTSDSRFLETKGRLEANTSKNIIGQLMQKYMEKLFKQATVDPQLFILFMSINNDIRSPLALYHPSVIFKVLSAGK